MTATVDVTHFRECGFQVFESVVPRAVIESVRKFLEEAVARTIAPAKDEIGCHSDAELVRFIGEIVARGQGGVDRLTKPTRDALSGHFALETRLSRKLWEIPLSPGFQAAAKAMLGSGRLLMHMPPTGRYVLPGNVYAAVPPHQDVSYNKHMSNFVTMWVPLVEIDDDCGGVTVYVGSGREPEHPIEQAASEFWQKGVPTGSYPARHCKIKVGDVLAFSPFVIHQSMPNRSNRTRLSIDFRLFGEQDSSTKHYLDLQTLQVIAPPQGVNHANV